IWGGRFITQDVLQTEVARGATWDGIELSIPFGRAAHGFCETPARLPSELRPSPIIAQSQKLFLFRSLSPACYLPPAVAPDAEKKVHQFPHRRFILRIGAEIPTAREGTIVAREHPAGQQEIAGKRF